jgi:hypothetical protein
VASFDDGTLVIRLRRMTVITELKDAAFGSALQIDRSRMSKG